MPTPIETIRSYEMSRFGLDGSNPDHIMLWEATEPLEPLKPTDYSEDGFAFGSLQRALDSQEEVL